MRTDGRDDGTAISAPQLLGPGVRRMRLVPRSCMAAVSTTYRPEDERIWKLNRR